MMRTGIVMAGCSRGGAAESRYRGAWHGHGLSALWRGAREHGKSSDHDQGRRRAGRAGGYTSRPLFAEAARRPQQQELGKPTKIAAADAGNRKEEKQKPQEQEKQSLSLG